MKQKLMALTLMLFLGTGMASADHWLHVRVSESGDGEQVSVNIPLSVVQAILPAIETDDFRGGTADRSRASTCTRSSRPSGSLPMPNS